MVGKKAIFSGSSHYQGLGLEYELSERYNSIDWLNKNGIQELPKYISADYDIHRKYRWSKLLSDKLNLIEWNCADDILLPDNDIDLLNGLLKKSINVNNVEYIFFELTSLIRLHTKYDSYTAGELLELVNQNKIPIELIPQIKKWLDNNESGVTYNLFKSNFIKVKEIYPNIKFYVCDWYDTSEGKLKQDFNQNTLVFPNYKNIQEGLNVEKLTIKDSAFCYNYNNITWDIKLEDLHASKKGHKIISDEFYKQINKSFI